MDVRSSAVFVSPRQLRRRVVRVIKGAVGSTNKIVSTNPTLSGTATSSIDSSHGPKFAGTTADSRGSASSFDTDSDFEPSGEEVDYSSDNDESAPDIKSDLAEWSVAHAVNGEQLSSLLKILKKHECFKDLPSDSRTLLSTPRLSPIVKLAPGEYIHRGLELCIRRVLESERLPSIGDIQLQFNIDGLPLVKSSSIQLWPILGCISNLPKSKPFVVGLYCGNSKPADSSDYLKEFVRELKCVHENGVLGKAVILKGFICDSPARAYILKVKGHTGYSSCLKCTVEGSREDSRTFFTVVNAEKRTDLSFRAQTDENHHVGDSILTELKIDMIESFPYEYMHLVCLGVMRKLLLLWMRGDFKIFRLSSSQVDVISARLLELAPHIPSEFNRKPRSLREIDRWKATEFRQFLLYTGVIVMAKVLPEDHYRLFMCLSAAICILCSEKHYLIYNSYAKDLLVYFVQRFTQLYGSKHVSHNVHGLIHLSDDCKLYGPLDTFSAFKFENYLGHLKHLIRGKSKHLQQLHRRLEEHEARFADKDGRQFDSHGFILENPSRIDSSRFSKVRRPNYMLRCDKVKDSYCVVEAGILRVKCFEKDGENFTVMGDLFQKIDSLFEIPCSSNMLGIYKIHLGRPTSVKFAANQIVSKCLVLPIGQNEIAVFPVIHTLV